MDFPEIFFTNLQIKSELGFVMKQLSNWWVLLAMLIATAGALIHVAAVFGGPSWFMFFNAPPSVVASAREGTLLAPVSSLIIATLMALCTLYAGSVLGLIRRPPLQRVGLASMATICLLRALILVPLAIGHPELRNTFEFVSAIIWFAAGVGFAVGFCSTKAAKHEGAQLDCFNTNPSP